MVSTKRTRIFKCNDHRLDNFIGRVNLSLTMKTTFLLHSQTSINSKLKFKGSEWKPSRAFWILLSLQFVQYTSFPKNISNINSITHCYISMKVKEDFTYWHDFFFRNAKNWNNYQTTTKCGFLIFMQLLNNPNILLTFR